MSSRNGKRLPPPSQERLKALMTGNRLTPERYHARLSKMRKAALESFEPLDVVEAMQALYANGMKRVARGDHRMICEWLNRIGLTPGAHDMDERIEALRSMVREAAARRVQMTQEPPPPPELPAPRDE